jgi:hypothetical protein
MFLSGTPETTKKEAPCATLAPILNLFRSRGAERAENPFYVGITPPAFRAW